MLVSIYWQSCNCFLFLLGLKWIYCRKWEPGFSLSEKELKNKEKGKVRMKHYNALELEVSVWTHGL